MGLGNDLDDTHGCMVLKENLLGLELPILLAIIFD